jgi:hypothetical protein
MRGRGLPDALGVHPGIKARGIQGKWPPRADGTMGKGGLVNQDKVVLNWYNRGLWLLLLHHEPCNIVASTFTFLHF